MIDKTPIEAPEPRYPEPLVRAIRSLTIAVWCVAVALFLLFGSYFLTFTGTLNKILRSASSKAAMTTPAPSSSALQPGRFEGKDFSELTVEKKIQYASVILLTKTERSGSRTRAIISEIVKLKPGTEFHYKVGEELSLLSLSPLDGPDHSPDGEIVFLVGSPAQMRESSGYSGGRLDSLGGMTLAELRELVKQKQE